MYRMYLVECISCHVIIAHTRTLKHTHTHTHTQTHTLSLSLSLTDPHTHTQTHTHKHTHTTTHLSAPMKVNAQNTPHFCSSANRGILIGLVKFTLFYSLFVA